MTCMLLLAMAAGAAHHKRHHSRVNDLSKFYGPGAVQTVADGSGTNGTVDGAAVNTNILKDGYWYVDCRPDLMEKKGDKFGNGASRYEAGATAGTSIVRYDAIMDRENQEAMTPAVCFDFCRTVPDMQFFGLTNGRDCYCEHYYKATTGGSDVCDLPCEGDSAKTCGGSGISSLYQMHSCEGGFAAEIGALTSDVEDMYDDVSDAGMAAASARDAVQASGDALEKLAEGPASYLAQAAKAAAGPLAKSSAALTGVEDKFDKIESEFMSKQINPAGTLDASDRKAVEAMMRKSTVTMKEAEGMLKPAAQTLNAVRPASPTADEADASKAAGTFVSIIDGADAVCGGELTGQPKEGLSLGQCAAACDAEAPKSSSDWCVGFQFFDGSAWMDSGEGSLCFLLKAVAEATTYECESSFLQVRRQTVPVGPQCHLRHGDFGPAEKKVAKKATPVKRCFGAEAPTKK